MPKDDYRRCYAALHDIIHSWIENHDETKKRMQVLRPTVIGQRSAGTESGKGGDRSCFNLQNYGNCLRRDAGTCVYEHPTSEKGVNGKCKDKGKNKVKAKGTSKNGKGKKGDRSRSPDSRANSGGPKGIIPITDMSKVCKL